MKVLLGGSQGLVYGLNQREACSLQHSERPAVEQLFFNILIISEGTPYTVLKDTCDSA